MVLAREQPLEAREHRCAASVAGSSHDTGNSWRWLTVAAEFEIMNDDTIIIGTREEWGARRPFGFKFPSFATTPM